MTVDLCMAYIVMLMSMTLTLTLKMFERLVLVLFFLLIAGPASQEGAWSLHKNISRSAWVSSPVCWENGEKSPQCVEQWASFQRHCGASWWWKVNLFDETDRKGVLPCSTVQSKLYEMKQTTKGLYSVPWSVKWPWLAWSVHRRASGCSAPTSVSASTEPSSGTWTGRSLSTRSRWSPSCPRSPTDWRYGDTCCRCLFVCLFVYKEQMITKLPEISHRLEVRRHLLSLFVCLSVCLQGADDHQAARDLSPTGGTGTPAVFVCLFVYLFVCLSVCLQGADDHQAARDLPPTGGTETPAVSVCLFVCLSVCLFVYKEHPERLTGL